jgi:hypothetical protein
VGGMVWWMMYVRDFDVYEKDNKYVTRIAVLSLNIKNV